MGVPVVTLAGRTAVGRGGQSILSNLGLPELIAYTHEEYARIARSLDRRLLEIVCLGSGLRQTMEGSPLRDVAAFITDLEAAYRGMWHEVVCFSGIVHDDRLQLGEELEPVRALLAAPAAFFEAAPRRGVVEGIVTVHPDRAGA